MVNAFVEHIVDDQKGKSEGGRAWRAKPSRDGQENAEEKKGTKEFLKKELCT